MFALGLLTPATVSAVNKNPDAGLIAAVQPSWSRSAG